jgi:hypothetical protein
LVGSVGAYTNAGNFPSSPAIITIEGVDADAEFEGFIKADCGFGNVGNGFGFNTVGSGGGSGSGASAGGSGSGPTAGIGEIRVLANCGTTEHQINNVEFKTPVPGIDPAVQAGVPGDYPVLPGEVRVSSITNYGTGDLQIFFDEDIFPLSIRIRDSNGNIQCGNSTSGPGIDNAMVFTGVVMNADPDFTWYIELSCTPCP